MTIAIKLILCLLPILISSGCKKIDDDEISPEYKKIIVTQPILELGEGGLKKKPPEKIAIQLVDYFERSNNKENADLIRICAAMERLKELGNKSKCNDMLEGDEDQRCAVKAGYWKGNLHKTLGAVAIDLNDDKISDYIVSGEYCTGFSHVYTVDYFVMLSQKNGTHKMAMTTNANSFSLLPNVKNGAKLIVEGISSYNGDSQNVWSFENGSYRNEACFHKSKPDGEIEFKRTECFIPPDAVRTK